MMYCPFCKSSVQQEALPVMRLSAKRRKVFEAVLSAGSSGVDADDLKSRLFRNQSDTTVRTMIHQINKLVAPLHIRCKGNIYRLERA